MFYCQIHYIVYSKLNRVYNKLKQFEIIKLKKKYQQHFFGNRHIFSREKSCHQEVLKICNFKKYTQQSKYTVIQKIIDNLRLRFLIIKFHYCYSLLSITIKAYHLARSMQVRHNSKFVISRSKQNCLSHSFFIWRRKLCALYNLQFLIHLNLIFLSMNKRFFLITMVLLSKNLQF